MKTDDEMIIKHLLQDDECRVDNFARRSYEKSVIYWK